LNAQINHKSGSFGLLRDNTYLKLSFIYLEIIHQREGEEGLKIQLQLVLMIDQKLRENGERTLRC